MKRACLKRANCVAFGIAAGRFLENLLTQTTSHWTPLFWVLSSTPAKCDVDQVNAFEKVDDRIDILHIHKHTDTIR